MRKNQTLIAMCFLAPYLIIFTVFRLIPSFASIYISLTRWSIVGSPEFIGFDNYIALARDPHFIRALTNNFHFMLWIMPPLIVLSLLAAVTLNEKIPGRNVVRVIAVIPFVMIPAVVGIMWNWLYDANFGILNYLLSLLGVPTVGWLINSDIALMSVSIVIIWSFLGYNMILYLAGLQGISRELYEAAEIDGANRRQSLMYITIPLLKRTTSLIITLTLINVVQVYDHVVVMTGGGPSLATMTLLQYQFISAFERRALGYGSAIGVVILVILIVLIKLQNLIFKQDKELS